MSNYPPGAANDPRAPYNEPLTKYAKIVAEVSVDIGTMVDVYVELDEDGYPDMEELREARGATVHGVAKSSCCSSSPKQV